MNFTLPKTVTINGREHAIRYDFRVILEIIAMLGDADLSGAEKTEALLTMFYVHPEELDFDKLEDAVTECFHFIDNSERTKTKSPKLMDWEQDFEYIIAPVNRVLGFECRAVEYDPETNTGGVHWWTFMAAFMEIGGDCLYSQIVSIRDKQARKKRLEKYEREWLRRNGDLVRLKTHYSDSEEALLKEWT